MIAKPSSVTDLSTLVQQLDAADHAARLAWAYTLDEPEQLALYRLARGTEVHADDFVADTVQIFPGRNGLPLFNRFEKRFVKIGDTVVGYNHNDHIGGPLNFLVRRLIGPGHFTAYDAPDAAEVWVDYRLVPTQQHPEFPPLVDNEYGLRALVFGNMVDVIRKVSDHVMIGNAYKDKSPGRTAWTRLGSLFPTAPFVLVRPS